MAVRIRKYRKRPTRRVRRVRRTMRSKRLTQGKVYSFKRTCQIFPWYFNGADWIQYTNNEIVNYVGAPSISGIFKFRLDDLPNPSDFTQLYEQFKITGVKLRFIPFYGTESSNTTLFTDTLAMCIDRGANDQVNASPSFNSLLENQDVKLRNTQRPFSLWLGAPVVHQGGDAQTQIVYKTSPWLDSELPTRSRIVDHHGIKFAWPTSRSAESSCGFKVFATYYIKCRNPQ